MGRRKGFRAKQSPYINPEEQKSLLSAVEGDENIDEITRSELMKGLSTPGAMTKVAFSQLKDTLGQAQDGTNPLYAGRQLQKRTTQVMKEQPGRTQTILSRSV